ncbi:hypothetical protein BB560_000310 [Smittium megazygosporum]|uniref:DHHA2 domain-containing protein n=1 Tax=Smittium megazygosporum TaxID=133381 RepID=A0A2T9ZKN7_9FUNG|nr:hypothetical protein BB560_000310 [Smittium megazygosporum]
MASFKDFANSIIAARAALASKAYKKQLTIVLGNQAADLDSMVSSIAFSYYLSLLPSADQKHNLQDNLILPVINIKASELRLRKDCEYVLSSFLSFETGSKKSALGFFIDELEEPMQILNETVNYKEIQSKRVYIVDHNVLTFEQNFLSKYVSGIVDHHFDEKKYSNLDPRLIRPVGSCTSLVALLLRTRFKELGLQNYSEIMPKSLVLALIAPILIDTHNMKAPGDKITDIDRDSVDWLLSILETYSLDTFKIDSSTNDFELKDEHLNSKFQKKIFFKHLSKLKKDISSYSMLDLFEKDFKQLRISGADHLPYIQVGISSIPARLESILPSESHIKDMSAACAEICENKTLDIFILLTHGSIKQDIEVSVYGREFVIFFSPNLDKSFCTRMIESLTLHTNLALCPYSNTNYKNILQHTADQKRKSYDNSLGNNMFLFTQENVAASRKQVIPIINDILNTKDTSPSNL